MYAYEIVGGGQPFPELHVSLKQGEQIRAEGGAMSYMDGTVKMETKAGGFWKGLRRSLSGESFFQNMFHGPGKVVFAPVLPGVIKKFDIAPGAGWIFQKDAYLAGSPNLEISSKWGGFKSMLSGKGAFLTHISAPESYGVAFVSAYGAIQEHQVPPGSELVVDNGIFFASQETAQFRISKVRKTKSFLFGGEGLVLRFSGPCTVYTQSRGQRSLVDYVRRFILSSYQWQ